MLAAQNTKVVVSFVKKNKKPNATCSNDHVGADLLQPLLRCLRPVQFLHADPRGRPLHQAVQPDVVLQPPQDVWVTVTEDVSAGLTGATDGHTCQACTAAELQNSPGTHTRKGLRVEDSVVVLEIGLGLETGF